MDRIEAERIISDVLWPVDEPTGRQMLHDLLDERGLSALTDEAVITLAQRQIARDASR